MPVFIILTAVNAHSGDIGFVDMNRILTEAQDALDVRDLLKLEEDRYALRLDKRAAFLKERIGRTLQGRYAAGDTVHEEYQIELNEIKQDYQHMENLIEFREIELTQWLLKKIIDAVKDVANKKGHRYIFELTEGRIFFQDNKDDITDDVIRLMDRVNYEVRLLDDLKAKKNIHIYPAAEKPWKGDFAQIENMVASIEKRYKETKKEPPSKKDKPQVSKEEKTVKKIERQSPAAIASETISEKEQIKIPDWQKELAEDTHVAKKADKGALAAKVIIKSKLLAQPACDSSVLQEIEKGMEVKIIKSLEDYWYNVETPDGKAGYLFAASFDKQITGFERVFIKSTQANIRNEASWEVLGKASNEYAMLLGGKDSEWIKVAVPCYTGYVYRKFVRIEE